MTVGKTVRERILSLHRAHPDLGHREIAIRAGASAGTVQRAIADKAASRSSYRIPFAGKVGKEDTWR